MTIGLFAIDGQPSLVPWVLIIVCVAAVAVGFVFLGRRKSIRKEEVKPKSTPTSEPDALTQSVRGPGEDTDFLKTLNHELRTPLNRILGFSDVLLQGIDGQLTQEQARDVETIRQSGGRLHELVDDVLDLASVRSGKFSVQTIRVAPGPVLQEVARLLEGHKKTKPVEIRTSIEDNVGEVLADPKRLRQILINLGHNALKFTKQGNVTLSVKKRGNVIRFSVTDTGAGIAQQQLETIFRAFSQAVASDSSMGVGLGLAIAKELAEVQGATLNVESEVGQGSKFHLDIPTGPRDFSKLPVTDANRVAAPNQIDPSQAQHVDQARHSTRVSRGSGLALSSAPPRSLDASTGPNVQPVSLERSTGQRHPRLRFLAAIGHDLRAPLNAVLGFSDVLRMGLSGELNPSQQASVRSISRSGRELLRLLDDILNIARMDAGALPSRREQIPFDQVLDAVLGQLQPLVEGSTVNLEDHSTRPLPTILCDRDLMIHAVASIISHRVSASSEGTVAIYAQTNIGNDGLDELRILVEDESAGVAPQDTPHVFEPFRTIRDGNGKRIEGLGFGSAFARHVFENYGGRIYFENRVGKGAAFTLCLPCVPNT